MHHTTETTTTNEIGNSIYTQPQQQKYHHQALSKSFAARLRENVCVQQRVANSASQRAHSTMVNIVWLLALW